MARKKKTNIKKMLVSIGLSIITFIVGAVSGFGIYAVANIESDRLVFASSDLQIHFLELGNANAGDCIYIKAGDTDILVDAGSKANSLDTITNYVNKFVEDGKLEYAIITHAHQDHYACYATNSWETSLFSKFNIGTLITFAGSKNSGTTMYKNYEYRLGEALSGSKTTKTDSHVTVSECVNGENAAQKVYEIADGIELEILETSYTKSPDMSDENNNSVCFIINQGDNHYLFTGDLEEDGEESLVELNDLPKCNLFKAGHHGSKTSSSDKLLSTIAEQGKNELIVVATCVAGSEEYTKTIANTFPTQAFIDRVAPYTDRVYVTSVAEYESVQIDSANKTDSGAKITSVEGKTFTSMNGNIVVYSDGGEVKVDFSNNDTKLKDTDWMFEWRIVPQAWQK